ncbi:peptidase inhibitor family I36 protein [Actinoplanes sp. CA-030573]|uniref:peptidase inhibitor family I36 protein n=1 Tax=Actinoplanes sp. CA-030573 TaxID=3239898 RepID=UPI003D92EB43
MFHKRIVTTVAVLTAALGVPLANASPAAAAAKPSRPSTCEANWFCFYKDDQFNKNNPRDTRGRVQQTQKDLRVFSHPTCKGRSNGTWNDCMTSVFNDTAACWHLFDSLNNIGGYHNLGAHDGYVNLGTQADYNDVVSSLKRGGSSSCAF